MKNPIKNFFTGLGSSFAQVQGNARAVVLVQLLWSIPFSIYSPFITQYMLALGCTRAQVGLINAVGMISGGAIGLFAGWLTDRLGRKRTNLFADTMSWTLYCLVLALSHNFTWFIAASIANSFIRLIGVSWNCTIAEGTPPEKRMTVYWWLNIIGTLSACTTPLMGLLVGSDDPERLVSTMRWVLLASAAIHMAAFLIRNRMHKETAIGLERMEASRHESPTAALKAYGPIFRLLAKNPVLVLFIAIRSMYYVQMNLKGTFLSVTVVQGLGFDYGMIGLINLVSGLTMLPTQLMLLPKLSAWQHNKVLAAGLATLLISNTALALSPAGSLPILMASIVVTAIGAVATGIMIETGLANALPDADRAPILGLATVMLVILSAVFQVVGGFLAEMPGIGPRLPMALVAVLFAASLVLLARADRKDNLKSAA